jgi:two-component system, cell cycle sensor histidine kinase and response regulator CckA
LLFTDLVMPGLNGRALAGLLRQSRRGLKVLFASGYAGDEVDLQTLDDFLPKPYTPEALRKTVRSILDRPWPAPASSIVCEAAPALSA